MHGIQWLEASASMKGVANPKRDISVFGLFSICQMTLNNVGIEKLAMYLYLGTVYTKQGQSRVVLGWVNMRFRYPNYMHAQMQ